MSHALLGSHPQVEYNFGTCSANWAGRRAELAGIFRSGGDSSWALRWWRHAGCEEGDLAQSLLSLSLSLSPNLSLSLSLSL